MPTFDEVGIKGMFMNAWYGVAAPAGAPSASELARYEGLVKLTGATLD